MPLIELLQYGASASVVFTFVNMFAIDENNPTWSLRKKLLVSFGVAIVTVALIYVFLFALANR